MDRCLSLSLAKYRYMDRHDVTILYNLVRSENIEKNGTRTRETQRAVADKSKAKRHALKAAKRRVLEHKLPNPENRLENDCHICFFAATL